MKVNIEMLEFGGNVSVAKVEGRAFPGILIQGDTLYTIYSALNAIYTGKCESDEDAKDELKDVVENLRTILSNYEKALKKHGFGKPY